MGLVLNKPPAERVTGIEPACPAWEVHKWAFNDQANSEKCLIKCRVGYPALPADIRRSPWRGARLGARYSCPDLMAGFDKTTRLAVTAFEGSHLGSSPATRSMGREVWRLGALICRPRRRWFDCQSQ